EVLHPDVGLPEETVRRGRALDGRFADYLAGLVEAIGDAVFPPGGAQVPPPVLAFPQGGVGNQVGGEGGTPDHLARGVNVASGARLPPSPPRPCIPFWRSHKNEWEVPWGRDAPPPAWPRLLMPPPLLLAPPKVPRSRIPLWESHRKACIWKKVSTDELPTTWPR